MKLIKTLVLLIAFILLVAPGDGSGSTQRSLILLYQGDFKGSLEGCG